jgi:hypothetical protein
MSKPLLGFDTTTLNRLTDAEDSDVLIAGVTAGFQIRLNGSNVEEVIATSDSVRRAELFDTCKRLLVAGDCILPFQVIVSKQIAGFHSNSSFNWRRVDVQFPECERRVICHDRLDSDLPEKQRLFASQFNEQFTSVFKNAKERFDQLFEAKKSERPESYEDSLVRLQVKGGAYWTMAASFYQKVTHQQPDESTVRRFVDQCPPYRALLNAIFMAQYDRCFRLPHSAPSFRAGAVDLYSAVYLPYCEQFVTDDKRQRACFERIVSTAALSTAISSYFDFRNRVAPSRIFSLGT